MGNILKEIMKLLPEDEISEAGFEGANIVLYTKSKEFFLDNNGVIKKIVDEFKKRVELRPDPEITSDMEEAENKIKEIITDEAGITQVIFDQQRSQVIIEVEKPGLAIGKQGAILKEIRNATFWIPVVRRTPGIKSQIIEDIRSVLYENNDYRRRFLDKVGHRIYDGWIRGKKQGWVRLTYLGAGRHVGRSALFLQTAESRVLLDCGVDVSAHEDQMFPHLESPEFNIKELDAVIVTDAHLDHCGLVPYLYRFGYRGPTYCTAPTRDIAALLMLDYIKIMRMEGKEPIYTADDVKEFVKHTITLSYEEVADISPDVRITLYNAGHIIGSSMIHLHIGNGLHNMLYTGDMKFGKTMLLDPAATNFPRLETLCLEAMYGGRDNILPPRHECEKQFADHVVETIHRGGRVLVPVLGVGRAQEVMLLVEELVRLGKIPQIPVYIDGMVWDVTAIHSAYPEFLNSQIRKRIFHRNDNPFLSDIFKQVASNRERQDVIESDEPCVVLATSGMLQGGPSVEYFKSFASDEKNTLIFVNYLGEGSLGRKVQRGEKEIVFTYGNKQEAKKVSIQVVTIDGLTGHSGRKQLMSYVHKCQPKPRRVIVNQGESSRCLDLASSVHKMNKIETIAPRNLEAVRLK